jgi:hypothetical protein
MAFMRVPLVKLLCQAAMGRVLALEYMLLGMCGLMWPRSVMSGA